MGLDAAREPSRELAFLAGGGDMGKRVAAHHWGATPLGPIATWPGSLRTTVSLVLNSRFPLYLAWGEELISLYNDAYRPVLGSKPDALGRPFAEVWAEVWPDLGPIARQALDGHASYFENLALTLERHGYPEQSWWTFSCSPVQVEDGSVGGVLCAVHETTRAVRAERRDAFRLELERRLRHAHDARAIMDGAIETLGRHLGANRVGYSQAKPDGSIDLTACYADGVAPLSGTYGPDAFDARNMERQRAGDTEACADVLADPDANHATWAAIDTRAFVFVPLVRDGAFRASLYVNFREPHRWSAEELVLVEDVAARTWDAVERAHAQAAELQSDTRTRLALEAGRLAEVRFDLVAATVSHSPAYAQLLGFPPDKRLTMQEIRARYHPDERDRIAAARDALLESRQTFYETHRRVVWPDGTVRSLYGRGRVGRDGQGRALNLTAVYLDETERRLEETSRAALSELADRLRSIENTADLAYAVAEVLGRTLEVSRAGFGTVDPEGNTITIERDWTAPGVGSLAGVLRFRSYGSYIDDLKAGRIVVITDAFADERSAEGAKALDAISARALVNVPVLENGQLVAILYLNEAGPRRWTEQELAFVREVAERTRAAVARRRAEAELRDSEARLRLAQEVGGVGLWDWDIRTGEMLWSEGNYRNWGIDRSVAPSFEAFLAGIHPMHRAEVAAGVQTALDGDGQWRAEVRAVTEGPARWVACRCIVFKDADGNPQRMIGVNFDISERRRAEAAVGELNATLEARVAQQAAERDQIWRLSRDPLLIADRNGVWLTPSPAWTEILGWTEAELVGRTSEWMEHPDDLAKTRAEVKRLSDGDLGLRFENRFRAKDGRYVWFSWTAVPKEDRIFCAVRDVTAEKEAAAELAATQDQLRQAQKMEAVGQLTGGIAHDFNNLLGAVVGSLDLIRRRPSDVDRVRRFAEAGLHAAERGAKLTAQLLAFSRAQRLELKPLIVADLVDGMRDMLARTLGPMVRLELRLDSGRMPILSDPTQLEMAVLNLAINARDAMPDGGALAISTVAVRFQGDADPAPADYVELSVADTGAGMPPEVAARAFDPFFTTKGLGKGTGLGLSQVYGVARQAGGSARIESVPGKGTTIRMYLPRTEAALRPGAEPAAGAEAEPRGAATVFVVDDDPDIREILVASLEMLGYRVLQASDGFSALAALGATAPDAQPDLLIVDFAMPGMNGAELAAAVRDRWPGLPIVFASGYAETAAIERVAGSDAAVLRKPFRVEQLQAVVAQALLTDSPC